MTGEQFYFPGRLRKPEIEDRKERFRALNEFVRARNGWITSIPGDREVTMECLPSSTIPNELRNLGYTIEETAEGERILASAIVEKFVVGADGKLVRLTEGSTRPIAATMTHAGIVKVRCYAFDMP